MSHGKGSPWAAALIPRALDPPSGQVSLEILLWLRLGEKLKAHGGRSEAGSAQGTLHSAVPSIHHSVSAPHATLPYPQTQRICGVPSERTIPIFAVPFPLPVLSCGLCSFAFYSPVHSLTFLAPGLTHRPLFFAVIPAGFQKRR